MFGSLMLKSCFFFSLSRVIVCLSVCLSKGGNATTHKFRVLQQKSLRRQQKQSGTNNRRIMWHRYD